MLLIPYERFVIYTQLSAKEALQSLKSAVVPYRDLESQAQKQSYGGKIKGYHFRIHRLIRYRNSSLPEIEGEIQSEANGCSISIVMQPYVLPLVFLMLAMVALSYSLLYSFFASQGSFFDFRRGTELLLIYVIALGAFKVESIKSKSFFRTLFRAERVDELGIGDLITAWIQGEGDSSLRDQWEDRFTEGSMEESEEESTGGWTEGTMEGPTGRAVGFLPFEDLTIHTRLGAEEGLQKLESVVEPYPVPKSQIRERSGHDQSLVSQRPYYGKIEGYHFKIHRNVYSRESPPSIEGDIQPEANGCSICITLHPNALEGASLGCAVGVPACLLFCSEVTSVSEALRSGGQVSFLPFAGWLLFAGWLILNFVLVWGSIKSESARAKPFFCVLFQAYRVDKFGIEDLIKRWIQGGE